MGGKVGGSESDYNNEMNVIPLVDIMLVLLILFIITIPPMTQSVLMDLPTRSNAPATEVQIIADPNAEYKYVNDVMFLLQRGEIQKMGFVTVAR